MPATSVRTPRADADAPFAPSTNVFSRRETCIAAVVIPIIEAEIDRGSMSDETQECSKDTKCKNEYGKRRNSCTEKRKGFLRRPRATRTPPMAESIVSFRPVCLCRGLTCDDIHHDTSSN